MHKIMGVLLILTTQQALATSLADYPLNQLTMVGSLANAQQQWGIIRTPDNEVYRVNTQSTLGEEQAHVVTITDQRVTVAYQLTDGQTALKTFWLVKPNGKD